MNRLGHSEPIKDALRVLTLAGASAAAGGGGGVTGGVQNKIYLWHADGSTLDIFDPDQAGLIAALAAAAAGDTVWLPSVPIALTAAITIAANVTLIGISDKAALTFTGFSGTAITLSESAALIECGVTFVSNGTTAIGVEASAAGVIVQHVHITASGGTLTNHAINSGAVVDIADEFWLATSGAHDILWTENLLSAGETAWNAISPLPIFSGLDMTGCEILRDGSRLFVAGSDHDNGDAATIFECTNLATIRAAPATTATWTAIVAVGDIITTDQGTTTVTGIIRTDRWGDRLICSLICTSDHVVYGSYDGAWTFVDFGAHLNADNGLTQDGVTWQTFGGPQDRDVDLFLVVGGQIGTTAIHASSYGLGRGIWLGTINDDHYAVRMWFAGYTGEVEGLYLFKFAGMDGTQRVGPMDLPSGGSPNLSTSFIRVRGALDGLMINAVNPDGKFYLSEDRVTLALAATWANGLVEEAKLTGGGDLAWVSFNAVHNAEAVRISVDRGANWTDQTGDLWSQHSGNMNGVNFRGVWLP